MYIINAEIENKKTLDTLMEIYKLLGLKPTKFKLEEYHKEIATARKEIKSGKHSNFDDVMKKLKKK